MGRSLTQHSLPFSFGLKAAQWFHGLAAAARRLEALEFPVQTGGAAGTLAAGTVLTAGSALSPFDLADRLAAGSAWPRSRPRGTPTASRSPRSATPWPP